MVAEEAKAAVEALAAGQTAVEDLEADLAGGERAEKTEVQQATVMVEDRVAGQVVEQTAAQVGEGHKGQSRQQRAGFARYKRHPQSM
jgi:hypothetical protein